MYKFRSQSKLPVLNGGRSQSIMGIDPLQGVPIYAKDYIRCNRVVRQEEVPPKCQKQIGQTCIINAVKNRQVLATSFGMDGKPVTDKARKVRFSESSIQVDVQKKESKQSRNSKSDTLDRRKKRQELHNRIFIQGTCLFGKSANMAEPHLPVDAQESERDYNLHSVAPRNRIDTENFPKMKQNQPLHRQDQTFSNEQLFDVKAFVLEVNDLVKAHGWKKYKTELSGNSDSSSNNDSDYLNINQVEVTTSEHDVEKSLSPKSQGGVLDKNLSETRINLLKTEEDFSQNMYHDNDIMMTKVEKGYDSEDKRNSIMHQGNLKLLNLDTEIAVKCLAKENSSQMNIKPESELKYQNVEKIQTESRSSSKIGNESNQSESYTQIETVNESETERFWEILSMCKNKHKFKPKIKSEIVYNIKHDTVQQNVKENQTDTQIDPEIQCETDAQSENDLHSECSTPIENDKRSEIDAQNENKFNDTHETISQLEINTLRETLADEEINSELDDKNIPIDRLHPNEFPELLETNKTSEVLNEGRASKTIPQETEHRRITTTKATPRLPKLSRKIKRNTDTNLSSKDSTNNKIFRTQQQKFNKTNRALSKQLVEQKQTANKRQKPLFQRGSGNKRISSPNHKPQSNKSSPLLPKRMSAPDQNKRKLSSSQTSAKYTPTSQKIINRKSSPLLQRHELELRKYKRESHKSRKNDRPYTTSPLKQKQRLNVNNFRNNSPEKLYTLRSWENKAKSLSSINRSSSVNKVYTWSNYKLVNTSRTGQNRSPSPRMRMSHIKPAENTIPVTNVNVRVKRSNLTLNKNTYTRQETLPHIVNNYNIDRIYKKAKVQSSSSSKLKHQNRLNKLRQLISSTSSIASKQKCDLEHFKSTSNSDYSYLIRPKNSVIENVPQMSKAKQFAKSVKKRINLENKIFLERYKARERNQRHFHMSSFNNKKLK